MLVVGHNHLSRIDPLRVNPRRGQRRSDDARGEKFADGCHDIERAGRDFPQDRQSLDDVGQIIELGVDLRHQLVQRTTAHEFASGGDVPFANQLCPGECLGKVRSAG